jgi:capsular polysaccharide biosynthesis protein
MEETNQAAGEIDIKEIFYLLLHKIWLIVLATIAGAVVSWVISNYLIQPIYTSTAKVYVINQQEKSSLTLSDLQSGAQLTKDYMILVKSRPVMEQVIKDLNLQMTSDKLSEQISVSTPEDTRILEISAKHSDPTIAKELADSIAEVSAERMIVIMGIEKVNVMEYGNLPTEPTSPNVSKNAILGGLAGAILVGLILILINLANDSIRTTDDIEKYLSITALGMLPLEESIRNASQKNTMGFKLFRRKRKARAA